MKNNGWWVFLVMTFAFAAPLGAEENDRKAEISAAFSVGNSSEGLAIVRQAFAKLNPGQSAEAKTLIESILATVPTELSGQVVVAAIEGKPALGNAILSAIASTSETEQLAILSRVSFAISREPENFGAVSASVPKLLTSADANVSVSERLTSPDYNPSNVLSETGVLISPNRPDIRHDRKDLRQDSRQLKADIEQYQDDLNAHKPVRVLLADLNRVLQTQADITADKKDLRQDLNGH
jgi:hypothetical protein